MIIINNLKRRFKSAQALSIESQISIIKDTKLHLKHNKEKGLCYILAYEAAFYSPIKFIIVKTLNHYLSKTDCEIVEILIPLFNKKTAIEKFNAQDDIFWWSKKDVKNRMEYLDYILKELEKQKGCR